MIPLPFSITLENFEVPRDEGTETPSDYISSAALRRTRPRARVVRDTAHMNSPAMFPGDFWRSLLGWNYKFSQANWDPQNLNQTTLQVLYDPGWPFKWIGSHRHLLRHRADVLFHAQTLRQRTRRTRGDCPCRAQNDANLL